MDNLFSNELFKKMPLVGILRGYDPPKVDGILRAAYQAGLTTMEITMNSEGAPAMIERAVRRHGSEMNIGAGTVCNVSDLEIALGAGAQFIVTPILDEQIIQECRERDIPVFAGAFTPTEIYRAWAIGASLVKVFPSEFLGPDYIKSVLAPLNQVQVMPTGGVSLENMTAYWQAGARAFGMGSQLLNKALIATEDWNGLAAHLRQFCDHYRSLASNGK
jgi:2-dehydro-3-deoxyphosphogluconate aldolase/(4S)-4-hydroxy-2-oxoglutarate aldolase